MFGGVLVGTVISFYQAFCHLDLYDSTVGCLTSLFSCLLGLASLLMVSEAVSSSYICIKAGYW